VHLGDAIAVERDLARQGAPDLVRAVLERYCLALACPDTRASDRNAHRVMGFAMRCGREQQFGDLLLPLLYIHEHIE
jgi:hypothetical protein